MTAELVRARLDSFPLSRVQIHAIAAVVILSAIDDYDVPAMTFAAPATSAAWAIGKTQLGAAFSAGLTSMAVGSLAVAPVADLTGRRPLILLSLVQMSLGSLLTATFTSLVELVIWRAVTGVASERTWR